MKAKTGSGPCTGPRSGNKKKKRHNWATRGGYTAPIMVPATPGSELYNILKEVAEKEAGEGVKFKVLEKGGKAVRRAVQRPNPTATAGCSSSECLACQGGRGEGGNCRRSNIRYEMECQECPESNPTVYVGETSRNLFTRAGEHYDNYESRLRGGNKESFIHQHQQEKHEGAKPNYKAKVTETFRDCLSRQISEAVHIRRSERPVLNSKSEWHQPALFQVRHKIQRG